MYGAGGCCDGAGKALELSRPAVGGLVKLGLGMPNILGSREKDAAVSDGGGGESEVGWRGDVPHPSDAGYDDTRGSAMVG
jgi:hypothetical protein